MRSLLRRLRPAELDELGLVSALQAMCEAWQTRSGVGCQFSHEGELRDLGEAIDTTVYRVTQEALSNVIRHAGARNTRVDLTSTRFELGLCVQDDGRGFDASTLTRGLGLLGATERAAALGGQLLALGTPGAGTRIQMRLPLQRGSAP